eukprot:80218-Pyramimonas_sp.AAC.1
MVRRPERTQTNDMTMNDIKFSGRSREASRNSLEVFWKPPGSLESRTKAILGSSWAVLGRFGGSPGGREA